MLQARWERSQKRKKLLAQTVRTCFEKVAIVVCIFRLDLYKVGDVF